MCKASLSSETEGELQHKFWTNKTPVRIREADKQTEPTKVAHSVVPFGKPTGHSID